MKHLDLFENIVGEIPIDNLLSYLDRMSYGSIDKLFFVDKIDFDCIVDFGAADGFIMDKVRGYLPGVSTVAYEIDSDMIKILRKKKFDLVTNRFSKIKKFIKDYDSPAILLSSVIHEIYSYSTKRQITYFWKSIFESGFRYIIIRDMISKDEYKTFNISEEDLDKVRIKSKKKYIDSFERIWGSIKSNYHTLLHYLLKYKYEKNWKREVKENYLPVTIEELKKLIPNNYKIVYEKHYILPYIRDIVKKDFDIDISQFESHIKLIIRST